MSSSQQDDREEILAAVRALPRIELAICGGLDGNGQYLPGVLDRLAQVEKRTTLIEQDIKQERATRSQKQWGVWIVVIGACVTTVINLIRDMIGRHP